MSDGSIQDHRFAPALAGLGSIADDRRLQDLLAATRDYAGHLAFVDAGQAASGSWASLFDHDESFLLARLLTIPVRAMERDFLDDLDAGRLARLAEAVAGLDRFLLEWLAASDEMARAGATDAEGGDLARLIAGQMHRLALADAPPNLAAGAASPPPDERLLRERFFALTDLMRRVQALAAERFEPSLATGVHEPAAGLVVALKRAHGRLQEQINRFPDRLADFYYHDCLELGPQPPEPDKVLLTFRRDPSYKGAVVVPEGQKFDAGAGGEPILFTADAPLTVTDARVAALFTLRAHRDPRNSPECVFGQATRLALAELGDQVPAPAGTASDALPLFGGDVPGAAGREADARIGIAVCSPILALAQGKRDIFVSFELSVPGLAAIRGELEAAGTPEAFAAALGRLFVTWLLIDKIDEPAMERLIHYIAEARPREGGAPFVATAMLRPGADRTDPSEGDELVEMMLGELRNQGVDARPDSRAGRRRLARDKLFGKFFRVELSTATGWLTIPDPLPIAAPVPASGGRRARSVAGSGLARGTFDLRLSLSIADPAIVPCTALHGEEWPHDTPVLRLTLNPLSRMYGLSVFDQARLAAITLAVDVEGVRDCELHNQLGQVDPARPFQPFGPLPDPSAFLIVGSREIAAKSLTRYTLRFEWAGLPPEGFAEHYRGYPVAFDDETIQITPAILRDGLWLPTGKAVALFTAPVGTAAPRTDIAVPPADLVASWRADPKVDRYSVGARNGFVKLQFTAPPHGFGDGLYPTTLAEALRSKPRHHVKPPNAPISPRVTQLTLGYSARTVIRIGREGLHERVMHLHPLGTKIIHPVPDFAGAPAMLPHFDRDGQLLIGLDGEQVEDELTLLFELAPDSACEFGDGVLSRPQIVWSWLAEDVWQPLEQWRLISDTTRGFLRSGIVRLQLPRRLPRRHSTLAGNLAWLRVATDANSSRFALVKRVTAQALSATRIGVVPAAPLPAGSIGSRSASLPGVLGIAQPIAGFDLRPPETTERERTRIGERLRHKDRAVSAWDYERLVLEAFPQIYKAKCLPHIVARTGPRDAPGRPLAESPGHVLMVLVPRHPESGRAASGLDTRPFGVDAWEIAKVRAFLRERCSPLATLEVISATYEWIQVRCHVGLTPRAHAGTVLQAVNRALIGYLSPWHEGGMGPDFDWAIRSEDFYGVIRAAHPEITAVSGVSLIRVWEDDRVPASAAGRRLTSYHLDDDGPPGGSLVEPGRAGPVDQDRPLVEIRASRPWSLPLPFARHIVQVIGAEIDSAALQTGIAEQGSYDYADSTAGLQIGETFIIQPGPRDSRS